VDGQFARKLGLGSLFSEPVLGDVKAGGPAAEAGLKAGDRVLALDGQVIVDAQTLRERIRSSVREGKTQAQRWKLERAGQTLEVTLTPRLVREGDNAIGRIDAFVGQPPAMVKVQHGPVEGLVQGAVRTWDVAQLTVRMLGRMLIGEASIKNLSGPITIADYAGQSVNQGLAYYLGFLALVASASACSACCLPMLDGGHDVLHFRGRDRATGL
jgi:regulator of sigma E protease